MTSSSGDQFEIHIGGDASGTVVIGHGNRVETGPTQTNIANDNATVYAVQEGEQNVHHGDGPHGPQAPRREQG
ncbi:hypothetical protein [Streptomyces sp. DSM 40750]|uniref:hypothetical protein n=1 Tax=Streptomyces sp. DSM 40750 TaxID=2801030 RepID=UPI00214C9797|nr:hypothetical protein [Streptomyces sp. DSM 40750]UUU23044.1 hypothetical protein JIX55_23650 [Streptomyces sp. DSM 40750]